MVYKNPFAYKVNKCVFYHLVMVHAREALVEIKKHNDLFLKSDACVGMTFEGFTPNDVLS